MNIRKVKSIKGNGTWDSPNGLLYKYEYEFEDGSIGSANHKTNPAPFKVGDEVEVETTGTNKYGMNIKVRKPDSKPTTASHSKGAEMSKEDWRKKDVAIIYQNALTQANTFYNVVGYGGKTADQSLQVLMDTADIIAKFVIEKSEI